MKKTILAASIAALTALAVSGQASASVYGRSYLEISDLSVVIQPFSGATIDTFTFTIKDEATLTGDPVALSATCGGTPGLPSGTTNDCNSTTPRLDVNAVNGTGSEVTRTNNQVTTINGAGAETGNTADYFTLFGPGTDTYSNSDAVIYTATLTNPPIPGVTPGELTHTEQITESEIQSDGSASGSTSIQSVTGFTFSFTLDDAATLTLTFEGIVDLLAQIDVDPLTFLNGNAQANVELEFNLENDDDGSTISWSPNGNTATGCTVTDESGNDSLYCTEVSDEFNLNRDGGVSSNGNTAAASRSNKIDSTSDWDGDGIADNLETSFQAIFGGLYAGNWTLTLTGTTSTQLRLAQVPEPGVLALLGIGLAGIGAARRRQKRA